MSITLIAKTILSEINKVISEINANNGTSDDFKELITEINILTEKLKDSETNVRNLFELIEQENKTPDDAIYITENNQLRYIIPYNIIKPHIPEINKLESNCNCQKEHSFRFENLSDCVVIKDENMLIEIDSQLETVFIEIFGHYYRTYNPFICWMTLLDIKGKLYIVDVLKFRMILPKLRLLNCGVDKIIHCRECVRYLERDFGKIGCYINLPREIKCDVSLFDYRIRPLNDIFINLMKSSVNDNVFELNSNISFEKYQGLEEKSIDDMIDDFNDKLDINYKIDNLDKVLQFREFLAKESNESQEFVMTDMQVLTFIESKPKTVKDFSVLFPRISHVLRLHATDLILIGSRKSTGFSMKNLKSNENLLKNQNDFFEKSFKERLDEFNIENKLKERYNWDKKRKH
ncbi:hypothetical protein HERIO_1322 [Hepatospora eriocheir]|uniref:Uncharacterized protein n=1 Tax=Hepatospora eriocheir TaxID=1081669 RepID=A0A1X0QAN9_9MICR|nr:hypothetical protein HERIO_1322 [Hepatospora eriocheir]